jgi:hypothetical protein
MPFRVLIERGIIMKQIIINVKEELEKVLPTTLKKDLQDDERICPTCHGLGMVIVHNPYGIKGDTSPEGRKYMFPYDNLALSFCPDCYNGVQSLCKHCGNPIHKGCINQCDCEGYKAEQVTKELQKLNEKIKNAKEVTEKDINTYLYCEEIDEYFSSVEDFIDSWECYHEQDEKMPEILWVTSTARLSLDASNILEEACNDLHEEAYDNCDIDGLQEILDEYAKEQTGTTTYYPEYKQYVKIKEKISINEHCPYYDCGKTTPSTYGAFCSLKECCIEHANCKECNINSIE